MSTSLHDARKMLNRIASTGEHVDVFVSDNVFLRGQLKANTSTRMYELHHNIVGVLLQIEPKSVVAITIDYTSGIENRGSKFSIEIEWRDVKYASVYVIDER